MTDREALYRAIIANPSEDTPRLVYADWLQENDHPEQAEFLRLGCWLETALPDHPEYVERLIRHEDLATWLSAHEPGPKLKLKAGLELETGPGWWVVSHRGFPRFLEFDGSHHPSVKAIRALAESLTEAFESLPTRWLVVRYLSNEQLAELLRQPVMAQLDSLTVQSYSSEEPNTEAVRLLANAPTLKNLHGLSIAFNFGEAGSAALSQSEHLGALEWLSIPGEELTPSAVRGYGSASWFRNLRALRPAAFVPDQGFAELCRLGPLRRLHSLELLEAQLSGEAWRAFGASEAFPALTRFEIADLAPTEDKIVSLARSKWFRASYVNLSHCPLTDDDAATLASAPWLSGVRWLGLQINRIGPAGAAAIARCRNLANLKHLDLSRNTFGVSTLRAIVANPALRGLISLRLGGSYYHLGSLTAKHFEEFLTKLNLPHLRHFSLSSQPIGPEATRLLSQDKFASLTRLELRNCQLTDAPVKALLEAPALQNLVELRLEDNNLKTGLEPLGNLRTLPRLGSCLLPGNKPSRALAAKLAKRSGIVL